MDASAARPAPNAGSIPANSTSRIAKLNRFGDLIDLHIADLKEAGKAPDPCKDATPRMLKRGLGRLHLREIDRERVVKFGRARAAQEAGPTPLSIDIGTIRLVIQHTAAVHGLPAKVEPIDLGRGLENIGRSLV